MSAVDITISGVLFDKHNRTVQQVVLIGEATLTGLGVGGGPIYPPPGKPPDERPPVIWGGGNEPFPTPPIHLPPIVSVPPGVPNVPPPGSPPVIVGGTQPTHPIVPPPAVVIEYPGIGKVVVPQPTATGVEPK